MSTAIHEILGALSATEMQAIMALRARSSDEAHAPRRLWAPPYPKDIDQWFEVEYYGG